jgi:hypothetical protein
MKQEKKGHETKKLELNKQTIDNLTNEELADIKAGAHKPCWENLWTLYHCDVMYTGDPETGDGVVEVENAARYQ